MLSSQNMDFYFQREKYGGSNDKKTWMMKMMVNHEEAKKKLLRLLNIFVLWS